MTLKTPEQIAAEVAGSYFDTYQDSAEEIENDEGQPIVETWPALRECIAAAIKADRAQRADLLKREAATLGFYYRNAEAITSPEAFIDKRGERYARGDLMHNMARAREAMLLSIGMDATEAFREAFK